MLLTKVDCKTTPNQNPFSYNFHLVLIKSDIYETNVYTDNSSICLNAIHFGMVSDRGGGEGK